MLEFRIIFLVMQLLLLLMRPVKMLVAIQDVLGQLKETKAADSTKHHGFAFLPPRCLFGLTGAAVR